MTTMNTKELLRSEIEKLSEEQIQALYGLAKDLAQKNAAPKDEPLFARLRRIQFDGPEDLSVNHDLYVSGEKRVE